jgi:hypothetical protein
LVSRVCTSCVRSRHDCSIKRREKPWTRMHPQVRLSAARDVPSAMDGFGLADWPSRRGGIVRRD